MIEIRKIEPALFTAHEDLLNLLREAFAYMDGRINPPSSIHRLNVEVLHQKVLDETLFVAEDNGHLVGCVFARINDDHLYLGKLAVRSDCQGEGLAGKLIAEIEQLARQLQKPAVDMEVRVELTGNQALFEHLGYRKVEENAHAGFSRPTSYRYRKCLNS